MCKVYEFPKQLELPKEEAEMLNLLGEAYVTVLNTVLIKMASSEATYDELTAINDLVNQELLNGMNKAIEKHEKDF